MTKQDQLAMVHEGMEVVDRDGNRVGTVREARAGDPGAVTSDGQQEEGGIFGALAGAIMGGDAMHEQARERLARTGYVRIDAAGLFQGDRFAAGDEVALVEGDTVRLTVAADQLVG